MEENEDDFDEHIFCWCCTTAEAAFIVGIVCILLSFTSHTMLLVDSPGQKSFMDIDRRIAEWWNVDFSSYQTFVMLINLLLLCGAIFLIVGVLHTISCLAKFFLYIMIVIILLMLVATVFGMILNIIDGEPTNALYCLLMLIINLTIGFYMCFVVVAYLTDANDNRAIVVEEDKR